MKNICIAGLALVLSVAAFTACQNDHAKHAAPATAAAGQYICPMNCEKGKTYDKPGSCPVCRMDLKILEAAVAANTAEYFIAFAANPAQLEAGKAGMLSFTPKIKGNESALVPLDLVHERKMHLILVNDDLTWFDHLHPEYQANGSYDLTVMSKQDYVSKGQSGINLTTLPSGGKYLAFADFQPTGGLNQVHKTEIEVAGAKNKASAPATAPRMKTRTDGYEVTLDAHDGSLVSGHPTHVHVEISKDGKPVMPDAIENYLGAKAHAILIEQTTKEFLHVHPESAGDVLEMSTTFAKAGLYRCWIQFQTAGKVHTADFVIKVADHDDKASHGGHEQAH